MTIDTKRLRELTVECCTGTFIYKEELIELLDVYERMSGLVILVKEAQPVIPVEPQP